VPETKGKSLEELSGENEDTGAGLEVIDWFSLKVVVKCSLCVCLYKIKIFVESSQPLITKL
jgi:hypothetical protein